MVGDIIKEKLVRHSSHLLAAIETCLANDFRLPALILMYSTIDIMAWLNRDAGKEENTRSDFFSWAETFLLPDSGLSCTGKDLYAARCGVVHSYTSESSMSRQGDASVIYYVWGNAQEKKLQELMESIGVHNGKAVHVQRLHAALKAGVARFIASVPNTEMMKERVEKFFVNMPAIGVEDLT